MKIKKPKNTATTIAHAVAGIDAGTRNFLAAIDTIVASLEKMASLGAPRGLIAAQFVRDAIDLADALGVSLARGSEQISDRLANLAVLVEDMRKSIDHSEGN